MNTKFSIIKKQLLFVGLIILTLFDMIILTPINATAQCTPPSAPTASTPQTFCGSGSTISSLVATIPSGSTLKWYLAAAGGLVLDPSTVLVNGTTYYAESYDLAGGCASSARTAVFVILPTPPIISADPNQTFCSGATIANLSVTIFGAGSVNWFSTPTGGSALFFAVSLSNATTYYAESSQFGCVSNSRIPVTVTLLTRPTPAFITAVTTPCEGSTGNVYTTEPGKSNYVWSVSGGGTITTGGGINDNSVTVTWNTAGIQTVSVNYSDGACSAATPTVLNVTVGATPIGGNISPSVTVCEGTNSTLLTLSGNTGSIVKWQSSTDNWTTSIDIVNTTPTFTATNINITTKYRAVLQIGSCFSNSADATITVDPPTVAGAVASSTSVCSGTNSTLLTLSGHTGTVTRWQYDAGAGWIDIANVTTSYTAVNLTTTTSFRAEVVNGACPPAFSAPATITVDPPTVAGAVASSTTVCSGTNSTLLTLSGHTGTVTRWQYDAGAGWIDIANVTTSYSAVNLTTTTSFRAEVVNGACPPAFSAHATITVDPPTVAGAVASSTTVCSGTNSTLLTLSGHTGTVTRWQYDAGAGWIDIANVTTSYTAVNLTITTNFRAEVVNGACPPAFSTPATITVDPPTVAGTVASSTTVCSGTNSTLLTLSGHTGTVTRWQYDAGVGWIDIANVTTSYTAVNLTTTTSFRAEVRNGACPAAFSAPATITVDPPTVAGAVASSASVCTGINSTILTLSGHTGTVTRWQYDEGAGWIDIANVTTSYTAVNLIKTTSFRAEVRNGTCPPAFSAPATITVDPPTIAGAVASSASVCTGINSTVLTLSGHTGTVTRWQYDEGTGWTDIANVTTSFTAVNLTKTTSFRAEVRNGTCPPAFSAPATITVDPPTVAGTVASSTSVCSGTNNTPLTLSGHTGTVTRWQYDEGTGWIDIANVTTSYTAVNLSKTTSFRAEVRNGACPLAFSSPATITVDPPTVAGAVASSTSVCTGINSTILKLSGHTGTVTRWQYDEGAGWIDIANVTTSYTAVNLIKTTSFRAEVQNGTCPPAFSSPATITVDPPTVAGAVAASTTVCSGTNSTLLTLSGHTGTVIRWQFDEGAGWIDIANITTSFTAVNLSKTTSFRAEVRNGACPPAFSSPATITVDPPTVAGAVASSTSVCTGINSTILTLSGHTGTVTRWQYDEGAGWIDIANVTTSYTAVNLIKTTSFRAEVRNGACPPAFSSPATITVDPPTVAGTVASSTSVCTGINSTVLTLNGHTGTVTRWQYDEGTGWTDIANVTTSFTAVNLTKTTSFRAEVRNGTCPPAFSSPSTITVDPPTVAGAVTSSTSVCTGINSTALTLSGHTGTVTRWQYDEGTGWTDIANVTTSFTAVNLTKTTSFRAEVRNGTCPPAFSSPATITVDPPTVAGVVASSTSVCTGINATVLTLSGHTGTVTRWQYDEGAGWTDIANVTTSYTAVNLTKTTSFRAEVRNGACPPAFSTPATITVNPPTVAGAVAGNTTVCSGTNSTLLTLSGQTGTVTRWQFDAGAGWIDIANVTTSYTAVNLTKTTSFRAEVRNGACPPAFSASATITVDPPTVAGAVAGNARVCSGTNNTLLTLSGHLGTISRWQYDNGTGWTDIANVTTSYTATNLSNTTSFRAEVRNGTCPPAFSAPATITVDPLSVGGIITGSAAVCNCSNSSTLTLSGYTGTITKWQSSTDNWISSTDISNTTNSLNVNNLLITTQYRAVVTNGTCSQANSLTAAITVNNCNTAPTISSNGGGNSGALNVAENTTSVTTVTAVDVDVPVQTLTYSITGGADQSLFLINSSTGVLSFKTAPNFESPTDSGSNNVYDVQVTVRDNCTVSLTDVQDLSITVTNANDAPVANPDNFEAKENQILTGNVINNDSDEDGNNLSLNIVPVQSPAHGTLVLSANGNFTYQPVIDYMGNDSFTYQVCDNGNPAICATATVSIEVVKDDNCEVFVPNSFSPNGDGIHDNFKIRCLYNYENPILEIYNRWGNLVYKKDHYGDSGFWGSDADAFWNGTSDQKGNIGSRELSVGTYYYILKLDKSKVLTGFLFLNK